VRAYQTSKVKAGRGNLKQTPQAPASVTAAKTDEVTIVISWQDPADQVALTGYNVYRSYNGGSYQYLDTIAPVAYPATTSYTDETLPVGSYTYRVGCQAATIESTRTTSNTVQIEASAQDEWASNTPSGFSFTLGTPSRVSLAAYRPQSEPYLTMSSLAGFTLDDSTDELVYDGTGSVGQFTITVDSAAAVFGWTIPDVSLALNPSVWSTGASPVSGVGATYNLAQYANHAGTTPVYTITSGGGTGISINASTGLLTVGPTTAAATYSVTVDLSSTTAAEQDWIDRSTGAGVVWAHDFRSEREVQQFRMSNDGGLYQPSLLGGNDPNGTLGLHEVHWDSTDGIGNSKCLRCVAPNGNALFPASTFWEPLDASVWRRAHFPAGTTFVSSGANSGTFTFPGGSTFVYNSLDGHGGYGGPTNTTAVFRAEYLKHLGLVSSGGWNRPLSALIAGNTGNGLSTPDRASGGETRRTYDVSNRNAFQGFRAGFYGRAAYHTAGDAGSTAADWDGTEFYVQFRVKLSSGRHQKRIPPTGAVAGGAYTGTWLRDGVTYELLPYGKLAFVQPGPTETDGYVVIQSGQEQQYAYETAYFQMYSHRGDFSLRDPQDSSASATKIQNVAPYAATCVTGGPSAIQGNCWEWPEDEWVTVLLYMKPGTENNVPGSFSLVTWTNQDTHVRAWVARQGQTTYTELFNKADLAFAWGSDPLTPVGSINNLAFNCYMNNLPSWQAFEHKYTQVIFSKSMIPCPQA
jgi:hypothetical protein